MTPRQLHAYMWLRHWRREEEVLAQASAFRLAQHGDDKTWKEYAESIRK
jgi:hypothetical protein